MVVEDNCYRVVYTPADDSASSSEDTKLQPIVHQLEFTFKGKNSSVKIGNQQDQTVIPKSVEGAFQINGDVYVNVKGCVHNTGIKIAAGLKEEVDLGVWKLLHDKQFDLSQITIASFTFDKKKGFCKECVQGKMCCNLEERWDRSSSSGSDSD